MTRSRGPFLAFLFAAGALAGLGGCGSNPYPGEPPNTLHVFLAEEIKGLDPTQADDQITNICVQNIYDTLFQYAYLKRPYTLEPGLATAMPQVSQDGLTYTIRLRPGVRYADDPCFPGGTGRELIASDVVFCLKRLMDAKVNSPGRWTLEERIVGLDDFTAASAKMPKDRNRWQYGEDAGYPVVAGLQAPDDHTVVIRLLKPYAQLVWVLAMGYFSIYPPEAVKQYGKAFSDHAVGTGPYVVEHLQRTKKLILRRNPTYREERYPSAGEPGDEERGLLADRGRRLPLNERVVATVFKQTPPQWLYFLRGYLDRTSIPKDNFGSAVDPATGELLREMKERGIRLSKDSNLEIIYDCFNMEDAVVGAPAGKQGRAIRRAISLASDDEWAIHHLYNDRAVPVDGPIIEGFESFDPAFVNPWKKRPDETRAQVLERARAILAEVGYTAANRPPVIEQDVLDNETSRQHFQVFQRDMREVGLEFRAYQTTWSGFDQRVKTKKAQMWGVAWVADYPEAQNFLQLFYGPNKSPGPNGSNYDNPAFNALYEQALRLPAGAERTQLYRQMQAIVVEDGVWVFRYRRLTFGLTQPWLFNYKYNDISNKYFQYCRADKALRDRRVAELNEATTWPLFLVLGLGGVLVAFTVIMARRTTRGW